MLISCLLVIVVMMLRSRRTAAVLLSRSRSTSHLCSLSEHKQVAFLLSLEMGRLGQGIAKANAVYCGY